MAAKRTGRPRRKRGSGTIERQGDGSYIARTTDKSRSGRFPTGSEGYKEAEIALDRWNRTVIAGRNPNDSRQKTRDFARLWLTEVAIPPSVQPRTHEFYRRHVGYATTYIGDTPIEVVDEQLIERTLNKLSADGLCARSVDHVRSVLHNMFNVAVRWKLRPDNPVALVPHRRVPQTKDRALTPIQIGVLLDAVRGDRLECLYHIALTLGLRRGELLGLAWSGVDFENGVLYVSQQVTEGDGRKIVLAKHIKSDDGVRALPLPGDLLARLRVRRDEATAEARIAQQRAAERATRAHLPTPLLHWNADDLVFCSEAGTLIMPYNFNRRFAELVRRTNARLRQEQAPAAMLLPADLSPHDLRKTALTDLAAHGEAKAVQSIAGHADIATTMELYAGRRMTAMRAAVEAVEAERKRA